MTDNNSASICISSSGLCIPDHDLAAELGLTDAGLDLSLLPPMMRRRTSMATQVAISAASRACPDAEERHLPGIFVSCVGEIQVTDQLCGAISRQDFPLSAAQFHNSVHNTASGYWSLATGNRQAMQAMAALEDGFALGILEAWCQLQTISEKVLLVVYDEAMPEELLPDYRWQPCAFALALEYGSDLQPSLECPRCNAPTQESFLETEFARQSPALAALPLFQALQTGKTGIQNISLSRTTAWHTRLNLP